jgi:putative mycofactocin binding protein MftB
LIDTISDLSDHPLALHPRVALRPEPFGALAYHYDTRRLNFLRSHELVALIESLADHPSARAAFDASDIDADRWTAFSTALESLTSSGFLERCDLPSHPSAPAPPHQDLQ